MGPNIESCRAFRPRRSIIDLLAGAGLDTENIFIRVHPGELVFLNGLLESYDDLAVVKTLAPADGVAVVMASPGGGTTVRAVLDSVANEVGLEYLNPEGRQLEAYLEKIHALE